MAAHAPASVSPRAISRTFGTPKPTLANSYQPELLNLRTFPTLMGYSSRILAESWESNLLYYAALADEIHARPAELNCWFRSGPSRPWSRFSPRIWRTGRRCCARCDWWAMMFAQKARKQREAAVAMSGNRIRGGIALIRRIAFETGSRIPGRRGLALAQDRPTFRVKVDMVVLSFQITDNKGHYINGLKPKDFRILEDGIPQKLTTFAEGNKPPVQIAADGTPKPMLTASEAAQDRRRASRAGRVRRHQRVRPVRHQQLYVSRIRLRLRRDRRFHPRPGSRRFGGGVHLQPQSVARRAAEK